MKVKNLLMLCGEMGNLNLDDTTFNSDAEIAGTCARQLLICCNLVIEELYRDYASAVKRTVVEAVDGFVDTSSLNLCKVISLVDSEGNDVKYRYTEGGLLLDKNGKFNLCYARLPSELGLKDEITLPSPRITERVLAYGILREYFSVIGDTLSASLWEERYHGALRIIDVKSSTMRMPVRRWM